MYILNVILKLYHGVNSLGFFLYSEELNSKGGEKHTR